MEKNVSKKRFTDKGNGMSIDIDDHGYIDSDGYLCRDEYNRQPIAEKIITLLKADIEISPMVIDGQWGSGKSEFCRKLIDLIETENKANENNNEYQKLKPIYLNAYQYDYGDDAFMMLLSAITKEIEDKSIKGKIIEAASPILKVTSSVLTQIIHKSLGVDIVKANDDMLKPDNKLEKNIQAFEDFENNLDALKTELIAYTQKNNIVIFIDELDRCNPIFALSLLEKVKHIFDISGIQFVFITNMNGLSATIQKKYGNIGAQTYLSKFFIFKLQLPPIIPCANGMFLASHRHFQIITQKTLPKDMHSILKNEPSNLILFLFRKDNRSLRDAERYFKNFEILYTLQSNYLIKNDNPLGCKLLMTFILYIISFYPELTSEIVQEKWQSVNINKLLGFVHDFNPECDLEHQRNPETILYMLVHIIFHYPPDKAIVDENIKQWDKFLAKDIFGTPLNRLDRQNKIFVFSRMIIEVMSLIR